MVKEKPAGKPTSSSRGSADSKNTGAASSGAASSSPKVSAGSQANLDSLRGKIDQIDQQLVKLMNDRAKIALEIGKIKTDSGLCAYAPAREEEVMTRVLELNKGPLPERCLRGVFRELISGSRSLEKKLRVGYLGPAYTYSHLAAINRFGESVDLVPVGSISAVFEEVTRRQVDYGVVPVENSTDGHIADTLEMFTRLPVKICGEVQLRIHHNLLGKCSRADVQEVYSKAQPLSQCRNWLARHLPMARTIEVTSTATAAQLAADKPGAAAIASVQAGVHYGLNVLTADIEDQPGNLTRFAIIGEESGSRTGKDKCSLMFEVPHKAGTLADAMAVFKRNRLNLTWIAEHPIARPEGGYMFFVELEGHEQDVRVRKAITALGRKAVRLAVLGSYARLSPVD
jgi:chorismate mutase/prephenate dehydratase